jgi:hypothetical protein
MSCDHCRYADWERTKSGNLHPDGSGRCAFVWVAPELPKSFYWISGGQTPAGGFIERGDNKTDGCAYYGRRTGKYENHARMVLECADVKVVR